MTIYMVYQDGYECPIEYGLFGDLATAELIKGFIELTIAEGFDKLAKLGYDDDDQMAQVYNEMSSNLGTTEWPNDPKNFPVEILEQEIETAYGWHKKVDDRKKEHLEMWEDL